MHTRHHILLLALCLTALSRAALVEVGDWTPLFRGVEYLHVSCAAPVEQVHLLRIDLTAPGVRVAVTPGNGDAPLETNSQCTTSFLKALHCQAAVNTAAFGPVVDQEGVPQDILGVAIADGVEVSPTANRLAAVLFMDDGHVRLVDQPCDTAGVRQAVSGFSRILIDGRNVCDPAEIWHPRTGLGVSADGKTLLLIVIDGRQPGYSEGAPTHALAAWLRAFGAWQAINLDGGGSTAMIVDDHGTPRQLNRPIHRGIPGLERPVAANLGIYAEPFQPGSPCGIIRRP